MSLGEELQKYSEYHVGFNVYEGEFIVNVAYPQGWVVVDPEIEGIMMIKPEDETRYFYRISIRDDVSKIFTIIDETISFNKQLEAKAALLKEKIKELQQLFIDESLETLATLEFKTRKPATRKKRGEGRNIKKDETVSEIDNDAVIVNVETSNVPVSVGMELDNKVAAAIASKEGR